MTSLSNIPGCRGDGMSLHSLFLFFILFIFIYGWKVTDILDLILLTSIFLIFYVFVLLRARLSRQIVFILAILYGLSLYAFLIIALNGTSELQFAMRSARSLINFGGGVALVYLYHRQHKEEFVKQLISHLFIAILLHGVLIIAMYLVDDFRNVIYQLTSAHSIVNNNYPFMNGLRITGLTYGLASTSVLQMFGILLMPAMLYYWGKSMLKNSLIVLGTVIILLSITLAGNSGLLLSILLLPFVSLMTFSRQRVLGVILKSIKISVPSIIVIVLSQSVLSFMPDQFHRYTIEKVGEVGEVFTNSGETSTTITLMDMYHLPNNVTVFLFGSGELGRGEAGNTPSDVGWIRWIFAVGIFGSVIMVIPYLYAMWKALGLRSKQRCLSVLTFAILIGSFLLHFKEVGLYNRNAWSVQSVLISACLFVYNHKNLKEDQIEGESTL
ncbi:hypothetical protein [Paenalkalicoccus suaedae]|nr:hypothetical protein [Paenalkalicoccus suaedae]